MHIRGAASGQLAALDLSALSLPDLCRAVEVQKPSAVRLIAAHLVSLEINSITLPVLRRAREPAMALDADKPRQVGIAPVPIVGEMVELALTGP